MAAHLVGDAQAGLEPGLVVLGALAFQQPADLVQLADVGAAVGPRPSMFTNAADQR